MERLTHRKKDGTVVYLKDNDMIAPVNMSGFDVRQVMEKLADYEDAEAGKGCGWCKNLAQKPEMWECCVLDKNGKIRTIGNDHVAMCISADFCPVCGRMLHN